MLWLDDTLVCQGYHCYMSTKKDDLSERLQVEAGHRCK